MQRNEKVMLIRDVPAAIIDALDGIMETQGLVRVALREIEEDFTPLLNEVGGPVVFVLSQPKDDWIACFSSLAAADEWQLVEAVAVSLEQPAVYAVFSDDSATYAYRYFIDGVLHEELLPEQSSDVSLDAEALLAHLETHGVPRDLIDDRVLGFGAEHLLVGYDTVHSASAATAQRAHIAYNNVQTQDAAERTPGSSAGEEG